MIDFAAKMRFITHTMRNTECTEAEAMADLPHESHFDVIEDNMEMLSRLRAELVAAYEKNRAAKVKTKIKCPCCDKSFIKKTYHNVFNSNKCKDRYWNTVDDERLARARLFS